MTQGGNTETGRWQSRALDAEGDRGRKSKPMLILNENRVVARTLESMHRGPSPKELARSLPSRDRRSDSLARYEFTRHVTRNALVASNIRIVDNREAIASSSLMGRSGFSPHVRFQGPGREAERGLPKGRPCTRTTGFGFDCTPWPGRWACHFTLPPGAPSQLLHPRQEGSTPDRDAGATGPQRYS